jgi:hypothetical protein
MRLRHLGLFTFACFLVVGSLSAQEKLPDHLLLGAVQHGSVFAVAPLTGRDDVKNPTVTVYRGRLSPELGKPYVGKRYAFTQWVLGGCPYRFRVAHDCFWGSGSVASGCYGHGMHRIPLDDFPLFAPDNPDAEALWVNKYGPDHARNFTHSWQLGPMEWAAVDRIRRTVDGTYGGGSFGAPPRAVYDIHFDVWPQAADVVLLFVQEENGMRVWRGAKGGRGASSGETGRRTSRASTSRSTTASRSSSRAGITTS